MWRQMRSHARGSAIERGRELRYTGADGGSLAHYSGGIEAGRHMPPRRGRWAPCGRDGRGGNDGRRTPTRGASTCAVDRATGLYTTDILSGRIWAPPAEPDDSVFALFAARRLRRALLLFRPLSGRRDPAPVLLDADSSDHRALRRPHDGIAGAALQRLAGARIAAGDPGHGGRSATWGRDGDRFRRARASGAWTAPGAGRAHRHTRNGSGGRRGLAGPRA